jgi:uncharacterized coiled-coil protein SlyX
MTDKKRLELLEKRVAIQDKQIELLATYIDSLGEKSEELKLHYQATKIMLTGEGL